MIYDPILRKRTNHSVISFFFSLSILMSIFNDKDEFNVHTSFYAFILDLI